MADRRDQFAGNGGRPILGQGAAGDQGYYPGGAQQYQGQPLHQYPNLPPQHNGPPPQYHQQPQNYAYQQHQQHQQQQQQHHYNARHQSYGAPQQHYAGDQYANMAAQYAAHPPPNMNYPDPSLQFAGAPTQHHRNHHAPPQHKYSNPPHEAQYACPPPQHGAASALSAEAPVFVPKAPQAAPEPVYGETYGGNTYGGNTYGGNTYGGYNGAPESPVKKLNEAMDVLMSDPRNMVDENIAQGLCDTLNRILTSDNITVLIEDIVDKGISNPPMRSMIAQLSGYLVGHLSEQYKSGTFRQCFLKRLHTEYEKREATASDEMIRHKVQGFTEFLAELLLHLKTSDGKPYDVLGDAMYDQMELLIKMWKSNIGELFVGQFRQLQCVLWSLKLCGYMVEDIEASKGNSTPKMDNLINVLKDITVDEGNSKQLRRMALRVVEMRAAKWDRVVETKKPEGEASTPESAADDQYDDAQDQENDQEDDQECTEQFQLQEFIDNLLRSDSETSEPPSPAIM